MRLTFRIPLLSIGLASLLGVGTGSAGTLVQFPNLPGHTPANLSSYLARPDSGLSAELGGGLSDGGVPYPAVVVLHGCNGMFGNSAVIADRLSSWGYVTLTVDSLGPRVHRRRQQLWQRIARSGVRRLRGVALPVATRLRRSGSSGRLRSIDGWRNGPPRRGSTPGRAIFHRAVSCGDRLLPLLRHPGGNDDGAELDPHRRGG